MRNHPGTHYELTTMNILHQPSGLQTPTPVCGGADRMASKESANETVSLLLDVLFDACLNKLEARIARAMFSSRAQVLLIPRQRPVFSCALSAEELLSTRREVIRSENHWIESIRVQEPYFKAAVAAPYIRIFSEVVIDPESGPAAARRADVLFVLGLLPGANRVQSCTLVYDEATNAKSPLTLY